MNKKSVIICSPRCNCYNYFENLAAKSLDSGAACLGTNTGLLSVGPGVSQRCDFAWFLHV